MSPSEFELRDALRHGEDDAHVDASAIMSRADGIRRERRVRYLTTAAAAIVVAGVSTAVVVTSGESNHSATSNADGYADQSGKGAGGGVAQPPQLNGVNTAGSGATACTPSPAAIGVPTDSAAKSRSFFTASVTAITVCAYTNDSTGRFAFDTINGHRSTMLTGANAQAVARSLDSAATVQTALPCPLLPVQLTLTLRPLYADGSAGPLILASIQPPCGLPTTNGTVVRYAWDPPPALEPFLRSVRDEALKAYSNEPSGKSVPSPTNS